MLDADAYWLATRMLGGAVFFLVFSWVWWLCATRLHVWWGVWFGWTPALLLGSAAAVLTAAFWGAFAALLGLILLAFALTPRARR